MIAWNARRLQAERNLRRRRCGLELQVRYFVFNLNLSLVDERERGRRGQGDERRVRLKP